MEHSSPYPPSVLGLPTSPLPTFRPSPISPSVSHPLPLPSLLTFPSPSPPLYLPFRQSLLREYRSKGCARGWLGASCLAFKAERVFGGIAVGRPGNRGGADYSRCVRGNCGGASSSMRRGCVWGNRGGAGLFKVCLGEPWWGVLFNAERVCLVEPRLGGLFKVCLGEPWWGVLFKGGEGVFWGTAMGRTLQRRRGCVWGNRGGAD